IKEGKYLLVALKDENRNFTFQPATDKIGFHGTPISVPTDSIYNLKLFQEVLDFKEERPRQIAGQKIAFGYVGDAADFEIEMLETKPESFEERITKDNKTDTLYYWYKPKLELDSTQFLVRNKTYIDTLKFKFRDLEKDSLMVNSVKSGSSNFNDDFMLEGNVPFTKLDIEKIKIIDKDSVDISFSTQYDSLKNVYAFKFDKKESNAYKIRILPEGLTDFFGNVNDTLNYSVNTKAFDQYGNIRVSLVNANYPVIVQLTDDKGVMKYEQFATEPKLFDFRYLNPGTYYLKVIFDENGNQNWDTGNFLKKQQAERIAYYPELLDVRAGWDLVQEFILDQTDLDPLKN